MRHRHQQRWAAAGALGFGLLFAAAGCGGGGGNNDDTGNIDTGSAGGRVEDVQFTPAPGAVFLGTGTPLGVSWPGAPPPTQFSATLNRYREPLGGESRSITAQRIDITRAGAGVNTWAIRRRDNFDLDRNGVYYLEVGAPGSLAQRFAFITGGNRGVRAGEVGRAQDINTGSGGGSLANVSISPRPGSVFISKRQTFRVSWENGAVPPANFRVDLRRYKEAIGEDPGGDSSQEVSANREGNNNAWIVGRRDNFDLDSNGVYYLELSSGSEIVRAAYIVDPSS